MFRQWDMGPNRQSRSPTLLQARLRAPSQPERAYPKLMSTSRRVTMQILSDNRSVPTPVLTRSENELLLITGIKNDVRFQAIK